MRTADVAIIAAARDVPLGVDVEAVRPMPDMMDIASRFFTPEETDTIATVPPHQRALSFFLCWTRKEAFSRLLAPPSQARARSSNRTWSSTDQRFDSLGFHLLRDR